MASSAPKFTSFRPKPKPAPESSEEAPRPELYFSDRRGDVDIAKYGTLDRYNTPVYRRSGYGYVLGLGLDQKIDRERSSHANIYMVPVSGPQQERLLTSKNMPRDDRRTLRIVQSHAGPMSAEGQDFIVISGSRERRHEDSDGDEQATDVDYRGIQRDMSQPLDPDTQYVDHLEQGSSTSETTKKNSALAQRTKEQPEDVQTWLDLIEHQDAMQSPEDSGNELKDAVRQQLADVRIQICEDALKKVPDMHDNHIKLYLVLLQEARRSWTDSKLRAKWQEALSVHGGSARLWLLYLDYVQSSFLGFKYESCCAVFLQCFQAFGRSQDVAITTTLHVFIRMTWMMHGAGYQEVALAIWQATLERHLSQPTVAPTDVEDFEQFWESEAPRLGEDGAEGWRKTRQVMTRPSKASLQPRRTPGVSVFEDFCIREQDLIGKLRYPGRTCDELGEDDAFHTILFSDIEPYLNVLPSHTPANLMVEAFLCFCGLPCLTHGGEHQQIWWDDAFISQVDTVPSLRNDDALPRDAKHGNFRMSSEFLLDQDFSMLGARLDADFVRRILRFAVSQTKDEALGKYLLAFEDKQFPTDVVKTAKQLLKLLPMSQELYGVYGLIEARRGKLDKANQVFSLALSMGGGDTGSYGNLALVNSWVWLALEENDTVEALWRLTSCSGKLPTRLDAMVPPDSEALQQASAWLREACEAALLGHDYAAATVGTSLSAVIAYLSNDREAKCATMVHGHLSDWFASHNMSTSPQAELNAQALARILTNHMTYSPLVKPALIEAALAPFLGLFPNNTVLLSLYAANEARFAMNDRVRSALHGGSAMQRSKATSAAGWTFAIQVEKSVQSGVSVATTTSHSMRSLYKHATHPGSSGAHSLAIWTSFLGFELQQLRLVEQNRLAMAAQGRRDGKKRGWEGRLEEAAARVKETLYDGIRNLPWSKDFIMLAFQEGMRKVLSEEELWKMYRVMQEKEMRLYVELDQD
ncbi:hypothetical protein ACEQ8H_006636 [Pleosporales sp. CAS-2024a]